MALRAALLQLVPDKPLAQISVRELARAAGISFPTFYRHYPHRDALVSEIASDRFGDLASWIVLLFDDERCAEAAAAIGDTAIADMLFWRHVAGNDACVSARSTLASAVAAELLADIPEEAATLAELAARIATQGVLTTIDWSGKQPGISADGIASAIFDLVSKPARVAMNSQRRPPIRQQPSALRDKAGIQSRGEARRTQLIDTAEKLIIEQGYGAVSTRRLAKEADIRPSLVHYYFDTADDLLLAVYQRADERTHRRNMQALGSDRPLSAFWRLWHVSPLTRLGAEFYALASHRHRIRDEIRRNAIARRESEARVLAQTLSPGLERFALDPQAVILLMGGLCRIMLIEQSLGVTGGHRELERSIESFISLLEG